MRQLALWWRRHIVGGLHDHEEGEEHADCSGCRYEDEVLWPPLPGSVHARVSGPAEMSMQVSDEAPGHTEESARAEESERRAADNSSVRGAANR